MVTGQLFVNSYHNFFARPAPEEDHHGSNTLYSLYVSTSYYPNSWVSLLTKERRAFETRVPTTIVGNILFRYE
jgi:hypothetical protein